MRLVVTSGAAVRVLGAAIAGFVFFEGVQLLLSRGLGFDVAMGFNEEFSLSGEQNAPTWYAASTLLVAAALFAVVAAAKHAQRDRFRRHWRGLAVIFALLSLDEAAGLHDHLNDLVRALVPTTGALKWGWVLFGSAAVLGVGLAYQRFFFALPPRFRRLFATAAALFVGGALGFEMLGAAQWQDGLLNQSYVYALTSSAEETLEMCGVAVLIYALLAYAASQLPGLTIAFEPAAANPVRDARLRATPVRAPSYTPIGGGAPRPRRLVARERHDAPSPRTGIRAG